MIDHTGITVSNFARSRSFYLRALAPLGYVLRLEFETAAGFGVPGDGGDPGGDFWISVGEPATPRTHVAFHASDELRVEAFHREALDAGGIDNGAPGERAHYHRGYFAAYVLDPDGYNIEAVWHGHTEK